MERQRQIILVLCALPFVIAEQLVQQQTACKTNEECAAQSAFCKAGFCEPFGEVSFSISGPSNVTLPTQSATLSIEFNDTSIEPKNFSYQWEVLAGSGLGTARALDTPVLVLTELKEGVLRFRATVRNATARGQRELELRVIGVSKPNQAPHAVVRPDSPIHAEQGIPVVLDAGGSSDPDGRIVSYAWAQLAGPALTLASPNQADLTLDHLVPGEYAFSLTVTDDQGATDTTRATVTVTEQRDDPPRALISLCGKSPSASITVRLPVKGPVQLCANASTDDKGIVAFNWFRVDAHAAQLPLDLAGSTNSILNLTNVQPTDTLGPYEIRLEVTDAKAQKDAATISVFVNRPQNEAPVADSGGNKTVTLPESAIVLAGDAKDDGRVVAYNWTQIEGPAAAQLVVGEGGRATASNLQEGTYRFRLTVRDDGNLTSSSDAWVMVTRGNNAPPKARAENATVRIPHQRIARLDASKSTDDAGVVAYEWRAADEVPASMWTLDATDHQPVLLISGLQPGVHQYNITVLDAQRAADTMTVFLTVEEAPEEKQQVEIYLEKISKGGEGTTQARILTQRARRRLEDRLLAILMARLPEAALRVVLTSVDITPDQGNLRIVLYVEQDVSDDTTMRKRRDRRDAEKQPQENTVITAERVVAALRADSTLELTEDWRILRVEPLYCSLDCSQHGVCSRYTKQCECDPFWMTNPLLWAWHGKRVDCGWSTIYVWLCCITAILSGTLIVCCSARRRPPHVCRFLTSFGAAASAAGGRAARRALRRRRAAQSAKGSSALYRPLMMEGLGGGGEAENQTMEDVDLLSADDNDGVSGMPRRVRREVRLEMPKGGTGVTTGNASSSMSSDEDELFSRTAATRRKRRKESYRS